jgi:hypothetical protein
VTIELPLSAETFEAELKEDDQGVLWLHEPNRVSDERMGFYLIADVLKIGWRIVRPSPEEQALLEAHGFESGRVSVTEAPLATGTTAPNKNESGNDLSVGWRMTPGLENRSRCVPSELTAKWVSLNSSGSARSSDTPAVQHSRSMTNVLFNRMRHLLQFADYATILDARRLRHGAGQSNRACV